MLISNGTYNLAATVNVTNGITVRGFGGREQTFVSGGGAVRCFYLNNGGILDGLTICNGYNLDSGGGSVTNGGVGASIANTGFVFNCTFTNNLGCYGGGVYLRGTNLLANCTIISNSATSGGASHDMMENLRRGQLTRLYRSVMPRLRPEIWAANRSTLQFLR